MNRRNILLASAVAAATVFSPSIASAQDTGQPIRLIVPYAPGGPIDVTARALAERVRDSLGTVIIDNKGGAGGNIGADAIAKAAPDGLTIGIAATATHAVNPWLYARMPYDAGKDFAGITQMVRVPNVLVMNAAKAEQLKIHTVADLIAYAKANPAKLNYGSGGNGSAGHLAFEYLKMTAEIFMLHVPYRGTGPMMTDLLSGRLDAAAVGAAALLPFIKAGKVRCIATGSAKRLPQLPDVATVAEQGFPGFEMTQWYGMLAPANLAPANLDKLAAETAKAVKAPGSLERLNADAAEAIGGTPAQFAQFIASEQERWKKVLLRAKVKPD